MCCLTVFLIVIVILYAVFTMIMGSVATSRQLQVAPELLRFHPPSVGFNPAGDFNFISDVKGTKFFLYFFNDQLQANSVARRAFGFHHVLTDSVYESYDDLGVKELARIDLSFQFMEVDQHSTVMQACQAVVAEVVTPKSLEMPR